MNKELGSLSFHSLYSTEACIAFELGHWISQSSEGERATLQELLEYLGGMGIPHYFIMNGFLCIFSFI